MEDDLEAFFRKHARELHEVYALGFGYLCSSVDSAETVEEAQAVVRRLREIADKMGSEMHAKRVAEVTHG
jgi:broad specificity phosphatase PhoE